MSANANMKYDSAEGGHVELPTQLSTYRYVGGSIEEMKNLLRQTGRPGGTKLIFQTLPKHMRRRAMSHNPKRLPCRLRRAHTSQMARGGQPVSKKRKNRKYRYRASNLVIEYLRRQRKIKWLETHVWHARRFHMINRWGFRLPYASCDKTYRACYRATAKHCLIQDISYLMCLEFRGPFEILKRGFACLTNPQTDLSITAVTYLLGKREGSVNLFRCNKYPYGAIGQVLFNWEPITPEKLKENVRSLWIWVHPSVYSVVISEFIKVFNLKLFKVIEFDSSDDINMLDYQDYNTYETATYEEPPQKIIKLKSAKTDDELFTIKPDAKPIPKKIPIDAMMSRGEIYRNVAKNVEMKELKGEFNRFRLTGPMALSVIANSLKVKKTDLSDLLLNPKSLSHLNWCDQLKLKDGSVVKIFSDQNSNWERLIAIENASQLLSNSILGYNILDPRAHRPAKRTSPEPYSTHYNSYESDSDDEFDEPRPKPILSYSPLWNEKCRKRIKADWLSTAELNKLRAANAVVPGQSCKFENKLQPIPILLIQRPGSKMLISEHYGSGFDIIAPGGCGMAIWLALLMNGARPGGLREFYSIDRESGTEEHWPDTLAGQVMAGEHYNEMRERYFRFPTNKRCNYRKLSVASPFRAPFRQLLRDWQDGKTLEDFKSFYVLRDRAALYSLNTCLREKISKFPSIVSDPDDLDYLVQVRLRMKSRGKPKEFALICLPLPSDFHKYRQNLHFRNNDPIYMENPLPDSNEQERKQLQEQHKNKLKRLRAQRVRQKRKLQANSNVRVAIAPANTAHLVKEHEKKMRELWLPDDANDFKTLYSVRKQCEREVLGYVTSANFTYTQGIVTAIGYVTKSSLKSLMNACHAQKYHQLLCLIRDTRSRAYRFAMIGVTII